MTKSSITSKLKEYINNQQKIYHLEKKLNKTAEFEKWRKTAQKIDTLNNVDEWKKSPNTNLFDSMHIQTVTQQLTELLESKKVYFL